MSGGSGESLVSADMGTSSLAGRTVLEIDVVRSLSLRSDARGLLRAAIHLAIMASTGMLVWLAMPHWGSLIPTMFLHGVTIVTMFAPMHECVHKTAFATPVYNEIFGWFAGVISFYNFTFYRYYHTWHHRYTQDPLRDPELMDEKPASWRGYLAEISGWWFWPWRPWRFLKLAFGRTRELPYVPDSARSKIAISAGAQLSVYGLAVAAIAAGDPFAWWYWFLPALLAQPVLRAITVVEHTGCAHDENGLTNTRTTLASLPIRLLMWNMPFHTEHHLYPSIPFHQLPRAHQELKSKLVHMAPGYIAANVEVLRSFNASSSTETSA